MEAFKPPQGFCVVESTAILNEALIDRFIFTFWTLSRGRGSRKETWGEWHLAKVEKYYTAANAPKLHKRFNFCVKFDEGSRGVMLTTDTYGTLTELSQKSISWVLLAPDLAA